MPEFGMHPITPQQASAEPPPPEVPDEQDDTLPEPEEVEPEPEVSVQQLKAITDRLSGELQAERDNSKFLKDQLNRITPAALQRTPNGNGNGDTAKKSALPPDFAAKLFDPEQAEQVLDEWIQTRGYVSAADVERAIDTKVGQIGAINKYYQRHPQLNDPNSDIYKAAVQRGNEIANDPDFAHLPPAARTKLALELVTREFAADTGKVKAAAETDRKARIARQTTATGGGKSAGSGASEELDAEQKKIAKAYVISEDQYKRHALAGVTMMAKPGGRK